MIYKWYLDNNRIILLILKSLAENLDPSSFLDRHFKFYIFLWVFYQSRYINKLHLNEKYWKAWIKEKIESNIGKSKLNCHISKEIITEKATQRKKIRMCASN